MSSLSDLLSLGMPQGSLAAAAPRGMQFNIPQAAPQPQQMHQPSKLGSLLGMLGDALLVAHGQAPMYRERMQQQQQTQALQGFLTNPDDAIARLMGVPGQAANGIDLYKAVHPPSETPLEIKLLQHLKDHPEDTDALHQINAELHPGMMAPVTLGPTDTVEGGSGQPAAGMPYAATPEDAKKYPPGTLVNTPYGVKRVPGGATASTPSPTFSR